jgi:Tfp pilus assembly protein PilX
LDPDTPYWIWNWGSLATAPPLPWWQEATRNAAWWNSTAVATSTFTTLNAAQLGLIEPSRFVTEYWMFDPDSHVMKSGYNRRETGRDVHRVTARGMGGTQNATVLLQSAFVWRYDQR